MRRRRHGKRDTGSTESAGTLDLVRTGEHFEIMEISDERARVMALRFGMAEGAEVSCAVRIPAGPIVLRAGRQEIAVGRELARRIHVRRVGRRNGLGYRGAGGVN